MVRVPSRPVEASIALSIVLLAVELVRRFRGEEGTTVRRPWLVSFLFGLLHGLGFAGALSEVGLPAGDIPLALFLFNVGVELGQIAFVAVVLGLLAIGKRVIRRGALAPAAVGAAGTGVRNRLHFGGLALRARRRNALSLGHSDRRVTRRA